MSHVATYRISVWLPVTTEEHRVAFRRAFALLQEEFQSSGCSWLGARRESSVDPIAQGLYLGESGRTEEDTHVIFSVHVPVSMAPGAASAESRAAHLEEEVYDVYADVARELRQDGVYQELIFVEYWPASYHDPKRDHPIRLAQT